MNKNTKYLALVFLCSLIYFVLISCSKRKFAEFSINDVSKEMSFIDSTSAKHNISHANVSVIITGEIDSSAMITYASYPKNQGSGSYELKKGQVKINTQFDYYAGETIWIKFTPKGSKNGNLRIKTRIN